MKHERQLAHFPCKQIQRYQARFWMASIVSLLVTFLLTACAHDSISATVSGQQGTKTSSSVVPSAVLKPTVPFVAIRMLDTMHGWALTEKSVLKTADGGFHWQDVTPAHNPITTITYADFMDTHYAWIAIPPAQIAPHSISDVIKILYTVDGGLHWQVSTIVDAGAVGTDRPHFVNIQDGWIEVGTGRYTHHS